MSILTHTVKFNKEVTFTDQTGVSFVNTTTGETATIPVTSATVSPADVIEYEVTWVTDPVAGDVVEFRYAGGNYADTSAGGEGKALHFNGDTIVNVFTTGIIDPSVPGRIECRIKPTDLSAGKDRHYLDAGPANSFYSRIRNTNNEPRLIIGAGGGNGGTAYIVDTEYDIVITWDGAGNGELLRDGVSQVAITTGVTVSNTLRFGSNDGFSTSFTGIISDVKLYSDEAGTALVSHWPINEGSGTDIIDVVSGDNGTLTLGTGTWVDAVAPTPMEDQILEITNCLTPPGTYQASIYDGVKDVDGNEKLATGVTGVRIKDAVGAGTVSLSIDGVALTPDFDTTTMGEYWWPVSGSRISWTITGLTSFQLGQGKL